MHRNLQRRNKEEQMSFCNKLTKKNMTIYNSNNDNNNNNNNNSNNNNSNNNNNNFNVNVNAKKC